MEITEAKHAETRRVRYLSEMENVIQALWLHSAEPNNLHSFSRTRFSSASWQVTEETLSQFTAISNFYFLLDNTLPVLKGEAVGIFFGSRITNTFVLVLPLYLSIQGVIHFGLHPLWITPSLICRILHILLSLIQ